MSEMGTDGSINLGTVPIKALRPSTCNMLGQLLDRENAIFNKKGLSRDWRGLAELANFNAEDIVQLSKHTDRTVHLLLSWQRKCLECPSIETLCDYLTKIERHDAIDDLFDTFVKDAKDFRLQYGTVGRPLQVPEVSSHTRGGLSENEPLTIGDLKSATGVQEYDAYVCYTEEDQDFLLELRAKLEDEHQLKLCFKDRDLLVGCNENKTIIDIIQTRCRRLLLVITPAFLNSPRLNFQYLYAQALSIEEQQRRIIPIIYKPCQLPSNFRFLARLDYTKNDIFQCFWERLVQSIRKTPQSVMFSSSGGSFNPSSELSVSEGYGSYDSRMLPSIPESTFIEVIEEEPSSELVIEESSPVPKMPSKKIRMLTNPFGRGKAKKK